MQPFVCEAHLYTVVVANKILCPGEFLNDSSDFAFVLAVIITFAEIIAKTDAWSIGNKS